MLHWQHSVNLTENLIIKQYDNRVIFSCTFHLKTFIFQSVEPALENVKLMIETMTVPPQDFLFFMYLCVFVDATKPKMFSI